MNYPSILAIIVKFYKFQTMIDLSPAEEITISSFLLKITQNALIVCPINLLISFPSSSKNTAIDLSN